MSHTHQFGEALALEAIAMERIGGVDILVRRRMGRWFRISMTDGVIQVEDSQDGETWCKLQAAFLEPKTEPKPGRTQ